MQRVWIGIITGLCTLAALAVAWARFSVFGLTRSPVITLQHQAAQLACDPLFAKECGPLFAEVQADLERPPQQPPGEDSPSVRDCPKVLVHITSKQQLNLFNGSDAFSALWRDNSAFMPENVSIEYYNDTRLRTTARILSFLVWRAGLTEGVRSAYNAYRRLRPSAYRTDLWRYMLLWAKGGVYFDAKVRLLKPLSEIFDLKSATLQIGRDRPFGAYWQGAFAAIAPRHEVLARVIRQVVSDVLAHKRFPTVLRLTGPEALFAAAGPSDCQGRIRSDRPWKCNESSDVRIIGTMRSLPRTAKSGPGLCRGDTFYGDCQLLLKVDVDIHRNQHSDYNLLFARKQVYCDDPGPPGLCDPWDDWPP